MHPFLGALGRRALELGVLRHPGAVLVFLVKVNDKETIQQYTQIILHDLSTVLLEPLPAHRLRPLAVLVADHRDLLPLRYGHHQTDGATAPLAQRVKAISHRARSLEHRHFKVGARVLPRLANSTKKKLQKAIMRPRQRWRKKVAFYSLRRSRLVSLGCGWSPPTPEIA